MRFHKKTEEKKMLDEKIDNRLLITKSSHHDEEKNEKNSIFDERQVNDVIIKNWFLSCSEKNI
jgi:hypothetical protein